MGVFWAFAGTGQINEQLPSSAVCSPSAIGATAVGTRLLGPASPLNGAAAPLRALPPLQEILPFYT